MQSSPSSFFPNLLAKFHHLKRKLLSQRNVVLVSYPKSGRTWLRFILDELGIYLNYTHDGTGHFSDRIESIRDFQPGREAFSSKKVILLVRDPRDVVVSDFFHSSRRVGNYQGNISEFIRDPNFGIERVLTFYQIWNNNREVPKDFLLVKYQDLSKDIEAETRRILAFIGIIKINEQVLNEALENASFSKMQQLEKEGSLKNKYGRILYSSPGTEAEGLKVRKGKVGGYKEYLGEEDIAFCNMKMRELPSFFEPED